MHWVHVPMTPLGQAALRRLLPLVVLTILSTVGAGLVYVGLALPAQERLTNAHIAYQAARQVRVKQESQRHVEEQLVESWQNVRRRTDFPDVMLSVSQLAMREHVVIPAMTYAFEPLPEGLAVKASMQFRAAGQYAAIRRFVHQLETTLPEVFIEALDVRRSSEGVQGPSVSVVFTVTLATFLRPNEIPWEKKA